MCLMVYLGLDAPLDGYSDVPVGEVGLCEPNETRPAALAAKPYVYRLADRVPTGWNCSCVFHNQHLPWMEDSDPSDEEIRAFRRLADIASRGAAEGKAPVMFSCWDGDEDLPHQILWRLAPDHIDFKRNIFEDPMVTGGLPAPTLVTFDPSLPEPVRDVL